MELKGDKGRVICMRCTKLLAFNSPKTEQSGVLSAFKYI